MTKEEFKVLQLDLQQSGKSIKEYLHDAGVNYSTYNYWRKKMIEKDSSKPELAPISFTQPSDSVFTGAVPSGATLQFPNDACCADVDGDGLLEILLKYNYQSEIAPRHSEYYCQCGTKLPLLLGW